MTSPTGSTRREFVTFTLGGALVGACARASRGRGDDVTTPGASGASGAGGQGAAGAGGATIVGGEAGVCTAYPRQTPGPFALYPELERSDITDGKLGVPLELEIRVVSGPDCAALGQVVVDLWHCDADGVYSGFAGQLGGVDTTGQRFLRGAQVSDADGKLRFSSIYPGWYPGRTTHIHFSIYLGANLRATSQLYFPELVTESVYRLPPYAARGQKNTSNQADGVVHGLLPPLLAVRQQGSVYQASLQVSVG